MAGIWYLSSLFNGNISIVSVCMCVWGGGHWSHNWLVLERVDYLNTLSINASTRTRLTWQLTKCHQEYLPRSGSCMEGTRVQLTRVGKHLTASYVTLRTIKKQEVCDFIDTNSLKHHWRFNHPDILLKYSHKLQWINQPVTAYVAVNCCSMLQSIFKFMFNKQKVKLKVYSLHHFTPLQFYNIFPFCQFKHCVYFLHRFFESDSNVEMTVDGANLITDEHVSNYSLCRCLYRRILQCNTSLSFLFL